MKIVGIIGSLNGSKTRLAMNAISFPEDVSYELIDLSTLNLSFADGRDYREYKDDTTALVTKLIDADGIIIGTPVYQASIPGALKNVFDLLPIDSVKDTTVGVVVTAGSAHHYLMAQHHLIPILHYLKMNVVSKYVFADANEFMPTGIRDDIAMRLEALGRHVVEGITQQREHEAKLFDF